MASPPAPGNRTLKTIERVLSKAGAASRTEARRMVADGRVAVNGKKTLDPDHWLDPERDKVTVDGKPLRAGKKIYLLLNKPTGYLCTYDDPGGRPTVYALLKDVREKVRYVGRLDFDTSGLLLMTNDTDFAEFVTNPTSHVPKTYLVKASEVLSEEQLGQLRNGVELSDGPTRPADVVRVRDTARTTSFEITITEGRNRQVRRMVEALGAKVLKLARVAIGPIQLGDLPVGSHRPLTSTEVASLKAR